MAQEDIRPVFHQKLLTFKSDMVQLSAMVTEGIAKVTDALLRMDVAAADQIIAADDEMDLLSLEAEEKLVEVLALQSPVAIDLRQVLVDIHMIWELERSGDLVTNIAKAIGRLSGAELSPQLRGTIEEMRGECQRLHRLAIEAYTDSDNGLAKAIPGLDDRLDELHQRYLTELFELADSKQLESRFGLQLAVVGRFYERIGDHAVNVAERVTYLITGEMPRHAGAERARLRRDSPAAPRSPTTPPAPRSRPGGARAGAAARRRRARPRRRRGAPARVVPPDDGGGAGDRGAPRGR